MDPIKNQIAAIDPFEPGTEPSGEEALHRMLSGSIVYSDTNPLRNVSSLEDKRRRKARIAGGLLLGAAAVTAGVLVASNFGTVSPAPAPAISSEAAAPTPSTSATPSPSATATPSATPTAVPTQSATPTAPAVATTAPVTPPVQANSVIARVSDGAGSEVARVFNGNYGDGTAGPVERTILDRAVVAGVRDNSGEKVEFGFSSTQSRYVPYDGPAYEGMPTAPTAPVNDPPVYIMDVRISSELQAGATTSGTNQVRVPNGIMSAYVVFDSTKQPTFATPAAAKAWIGTQQYARLKAMLLSLSYK